MLNNWRNTASAGILLAASFLAQAQAQAKEYTFSSFLQPDHLQTVYAHVPWIEAIKERTKGEVTFKLYTGGSILPGVGVLKGLAQGVADGGFVTAGYVPAEMPLWNVIGDMGWQVPDDFVVALAATEFGLMDKYGMVDWVKNHVVYLGTTSTPIYHYMCKGQPKNLADFKGLRIRTPGNVWARFAEYIGAVPVNLPFTEVYTGLERRALDCGNLDPTLLIEGAKVGEVIDSVNLLKMGPFFSQATWTFNEKFWGALTTEQRKIIFEESARSIVRYQVEQTNTVIARNVEGAKKKGIKFNEPGADLQAAYDKFVAGGLGGLKDIAKQRNVPDYEEGLAHFTALVDKWNGLIAKVDRNDKEALYKLVMTEIYDKLDPATYRVK